MTQVASLYNILYETNYIKITNSSIQQLRFPEIGSISFEPFNTGRKQQRGF